MTTNQDTSTDRRPCPQSCEVRANGTFHSFECFLRNMATDANSSAVHQGQALNAR